MDLASADNRELAELFTLVAEDAPVASGRHPRVDLLGQMHVRALDDTAGRNVQEHVRGCQQCTDSIALLMVLACKTVVDRLGIKESLGLNVSLVDALRSTHRDSN
jgi:hypothetical protein